MQRATLLGATPLRAFSVSRTHYRYVSQVRCSAAAQPGAPVAHPVVRLAATASALVGRTVHAVRVAAVEAARATNEADINAQIKDSVKHMRMLALIAPFAAVSSGPDTFFIITKAVASFIKVITLLGACMH